MSWSAIPAYLPYKVNTAAAVTLSNHVYLFGTKSLDATFLDLLLGGWDGSKKYNQILKLTSSGGTYRWEGAGVMEIAR